MAELELITAEVCPFAQRSHMALIEKGLDFERIEVNLRDKPGWFAEVSPYSKVPVLRHGQVRIYESSIINEYLEDAFPQPALLPASPAERARARIWIDFDNVKLVPTFYRLLLAQDADHQRRLADDVVDHLRFVERECLGADDFGPYWAGDAVSLVDLSFYPHLERLPVIAEYRGVRIPPECGRLRAWIEALAQRPSARATTHDAGYHVAAYAHYANGTASGTTARDMRG